jgi:tRNA G10  N-methylase Trm11
MIPKSSRPKKYLNYTKKTHEKKKFTRKNSWQKKVKKHKQEMTSASRPHFQLTEKTFPKIKKSRQKNPKYNHIRKQLRKKHKAEQNVICVRAFVWLSCSLRRPRWTTATR